MTRDESPSDPFEREANESKFTGAHESTPVTLSLEEYRVLKWIGMNTERQARAIERLADAVEKLTRGEAP